MNKKDLKNFFVLLISMAISTVLNMILYVFSYFLVVDLNKKYYISYSVVEYTDIICLVIISAFSLLSYFIIGRNVLCKFSEKNKRNALIVLAILTLIFCMFIRFSGFGILIGSLCLEACSPIPYLLFSLFSLSNYDTLFFLELLCIFCTPGTEVLMWLFSKIGGKKSKGQLDDSSVINIDE